MKFSRFRAAAMVVGVGVVSSLAFTGTGVAAPPAGGVACQAADGKVSGRGATFQTRAMQALIDGYRLDVCGPVAASGTSDPAPANMLAYNYTGALTGSGNGQKATSCRTDAFGGTDIPYDQATLALLNGATGATGGCAITFTPPYNPTAGPFPDTTDTTAAVMSFPIAGSSVAIAINLSATACGGTRPTSISLTAAQLSKLSGGNYATWNDPELVANNPSLTNCSIAVTRVVRLDKSGTTQLLKDYLKNVDPARTLCDATNTWTALQADANNTVWPTGAGCSALIRPTSNGGPAVVTLTRGTDGSFGYADLADATAAGTPALVNATVRNAADTAFVTPGSASPNCDFATTLPGTSPADAVGLNAADNWAFDSNPNHSDVTNKGSLYPICGLTFDLVYTTLSNTTGPNAMSRLTANQRRTLYSFFTYVFSAAAQARLTPAKFAPLPASFLTKLRQGFQGNF